MRTQVLNLLPGIENDFQTKATIEDVPALNERNLAGGIDVFISGHGSFVRYNVGSPVIDEANFLTSRWKEDGLVPGQEYEVYAVANPGSDLSGIDGIDALKALETARDNDIYRLYDPDAGTYDLSKTNSKLFLMDASTIWTPTSDPEQLIPLTFKRAAAKIEISFALSEGMSAYSLFGTPQWKFVNYSTSASVLDDDSPSEVNLMTTQYLMNVSGSSTNGGTIITYSYPHSWSDIDDATMIILNVPLEDAEHNVILNNYYAIPVVDISVPGPYSLERNYQYRVNATLETLGSSGENTSEIPLNLLFEVIPWEYQSEFDDIDVIGHELDYLMADPTEDEIREKVLSDNLGPRTRTINFWASGPISVSTPEVYYYDKYSNRIDASALSPVDIEVSGLKNGTVQVTSTALSNNSVKYIRFRIYLTGNPALYKDIIIRHYPLDYIQNVEGLWSSLITNNWVNWDTDQAAHRPAKTCNNGLFTAKVFYNNGIYSIIDSYRSGYYYASRGTRYTNLSNNRMYVIQITSTSDSYTVGRVRLDGNYQSNDHLVSPSFLIASQLGATQALNNGLTAASHCGTYKEVTADGRVFDSWRLPTREEIGIIMGYQYTSDTIDEVLAGNYYWTLEGKAVSKTYFSNPSYDSTSGHVRCVRDLSEAELQLINVLE